MATLKERWDGWLNVLTGWGTSRDKTKAGSFGVPMRLDQQSLTDIYEGDSIAAKIVDKLPEDMVREWIDVTVAKDATVPSLILAALDTLKARPALKEAMIWGRLYGGAGIVMGIDDGLAADQPLNEPKIRAVRHLTVLDRHQLRIHTRQEDPSAADYGQPLTYRLQPILGNTQAAGVTVHASRVLRFDGVPVTARTRVANEGWGDSVLTRLYNAVRGYHMAHDSVLQILADFAQGILKLKGLSAKLAANDDAAVKARLQAIDLGRSILRSIVVDAEDDFERKTTNVSGLDKLVAAPERRLCAEADMPHTLLLGESPGASLGEGGDSEKRDWYDLVATRQEDILRAPLTRLITLIMLSSEGPTKGKIPEGWTLDFRPLWQMTEAEAADIRAKQATADQVYLSNGVVSPEEMAISRFGGPKWSGETVLDLDTRAAMDDVTDDGDEGNTD